MITRVVALDELTPRRAYELWALRQQVFVVEQACPYPDLDGRDLEAATRHVLLLDPRDHADPDAADDAAAGDALVGCARVLDDTDTWRIGRVLLAPAARGRGLADALVEAALSVCPGRDVVLDAQSPLADLYGRFGFVVDGPEFVEDGIAHLPMRRAASG